MRRGNGGGEAVPTLPHTLNYRIFTKGMAALKRLRITRLDSIGRRWLSLAVLPPFDLAARVFCTHTPYTIVVPGSVLIYKYFDVPYTRLLYSKMS